jgi:YD repeat-containing protein
MKRMFFAVTATLALAAPFAAQAQVTQTFRYDGQGRVSGVATALPAGSRTASYGYDDADNRTARSQMDTGNAAFTSSLPSGNNLVPTQRLLSPNGQVEFKFEQDGNIVLRQGSTVLWQSSTANGAGLSLQMLPDGNLVLYDPGDTAIWGSQTGGNAGANLEVRNDGTAVILNSAGTTVLWEVP